MIEKTDKQVFLKGILYLYSNQDLFVVGPLCWCPNPRYQNKKRPQGSFVILVAAKGFGPLTKGL